MTHHVKLVYRCQDCGHFQSVYNIFEDFGKVYVGSGADFCDKCDGVPVRLSAKEICEILNKKEAKDGQN